VEYHGHWTLVEGYRQLRSKMVRCWGFLFCCMSTFVLVSSMTLEDTVYVNKGEHFTLPCKNDTPGMYIGIVWKEKTTEIYRYLRSYGLYIDEKYNRRSRLVNETSLHIGNASVNDEGIYQCILVYIPKKEIFSTCHCSIVDQGCCICSAQYHLGQSCSSVSKPWT